MSRILSVSVVLFFLGSPLWAAERWALSCYDRENKVQEVHNYFTSQDQAQRYWKFVKGIPWIAEGLRIGGFAPQFVNPSIYKVGSGEGEGEGAGVELPSFFDLLMNAKDKVDTVIEIADRDYESLRNRMFGTPGLQGYADNVADAYERAADAKKTLLNATGSASDAVFKEANAKVDEYNRVLEAAQSTPGGSAFSRLPKMTPVTDELVKKAEEFKAAAQEQLDLRSEQQKLNDERTRLEQERPAILAETRDVKALEQEVQQLHNRATEEILVGRSASGSYQFSGRPVVQFSYHFDTGNSLSFRSAEESLSGSYSVSGNKITMRMGTTSQEGTISGNEITVNLRTDKGKTGRESSNVSGGELVAAVNAKTQAKQEELSKRKDALNRTKAKYLEEKASYDQKAAQYASRHKKFKTNGERLKEFAYKPHTPTGGQTPRTKLPQRLQVQP